MSNVSPLGSSLSSLTSSEVEWLMTIFSWQLVVLARYLKESWRTYKRVMSESLLMGPHTLMSCFLSSVLGSELLTSAAALFKGFNSSRGHQDLPSVSFISSNFFVLYCISSFILLRYSEVRRPFIFSSPPSSLKICIPCYMTIAFILECDWFLFWCVWEKCLESKLAKILNLRKTILGKTLSAYICCPMFSGCSHATLDVVRKCIQMFQFRLQLLI